MTERTPSGGDRSEITYFAADGQVTDDPTTAAGAEIREYVKGVEIRRTYMDGDGDGGPRQPQWTDPGEVRGEPDVVDTVKGTWDVYTEQDGMYRLATTLPDLMTALGWDELTVPQQKAELLNLMRLPSYQAAPADLKTDVAHWLSTH